MPSIYLKVYKTHQLITMQGTSYSHMINSGMCIAFRISLYPTKV